VQEAIAMRQYRREQEIRYISTMVVVQSIMHAAGVIAAASSPNVSSPSPDSLNKLLDSFKILVMPELEEGMKEKADNVKKMLEDAQNQTPFRVEPMNRENRRGKGLN
jgi:hypothetical protein